MTRNRFSQAKHQSTSTSTNNLTLSKARGLFLEDNDNIDIIMSSNKVDILSRNITELRKGGFDKVTTKTLQLNETQINDELINAFIESANDVTNTVKFCNKVAADTISKYNQLKQEFDNNNFNQNITNIQLDDMFTTGLKNVKKLIKRLILPLMKHL